MEKISEALVQQGMALFFVGVLLVVASTYWPMVENIRTPRWLTVVTIIVWALALVSVISGFWVAVFE